MDTAAHLAKFRRIDATLSRLDPATDAELWIWAAMSAATHLLNAALHHAGATQPLDSFHTQFDGLYAVPDRRTGTLCDAVHPPGDVMHWGQPPLAMALPAAFEQAGARLRALEDLRDPHVRGAEPIPAGAHRDWPRLYRECVDLLASTLPAGAPG